MAQVASPKDDLLEVGKITVDPACAYVIAGSAARRFQVLPFTKIGNKFYVACRKNDQDSAQRLMAKHLEPGDELICKFCDPDGLEKEILKIYGSAAAAQAVQNNEDSAAVQASKEILDAAIIDGASDIHIEPGPEILICRFRTNGVMKIFSRRQMEDHATLVSRIKVLGNMDISEKRLPQDGKLSYAFRGGEREIDVRIASIPTKYGEKLTMRLIGATVIPDNVAALGMRKDHETILYEALEKPQGMILVTGPTGSGKSTTLYSCLQRLVSKGNLSILSLEDPVEYDLLGVTQVEISQDRTTFAKGLRSALRHDPDVLLVGEIRDAETAAIAFRASITGHLVLSTLHTNSCAATLTRLVDMGVEPYMVGSTLRAVMAQRLTRKLCSFCRDQRQANEHELKILKLPPGTQLNISDPVGCFRCAGSGYKGRMGIYDVIEVGQVLAELMPSNPNEAEIRRAIATYTNSSMLLDATHKLHEGLTSFEEVLRVIDLDS